MDTTINSESVSVDDALDTSDRKLVSMVIVNWNSGDLLGRCLRSIQGQSLRSWEVIIVDNASQDDSLRAAEGVEGVTVIRSETNLGFAAGQNLGLRRACGKYLMPLNFDIEMTESFLEEMVAAIEGSENIGLVTGKLLQMEANGKRLQVLYSTGHILPPNRFPVNRGFGEADRGQYDHLIEVFGASGAAPLYRSEMLEDIAFNDMYFDESLFTWYEDVDVDWRAKRMGWRCVYAPNAVAYHVGHPEGHGGDPSKVATMIRNRWLIILSNEEMESLGERTSAMARYELDLLKYVLSHGYMPAYLKAIWQCIMLFPTTLRKRRYALHASTMKRVSI